MSDPYVELFPPFWFSYLASSAASAIVSERIHAWDRLSVARNNAAAIWNKPSRSGAGAFQFPRGK